MGLKTVYKKIKYLYIKSHEIQNNRKTIKSSEGSH